MNKYTGVYKCRLCGERFADDRNTVQARSVLCALRAMQAEFPIAQCNCSKLHELGALYGYGKLVGVVESLERSNEV